MDNFLIGVCLGLIAVLFVSVLGLKLRLDRMDEDHQLLVQWVRDQRH